MLPLADLGIYSSIQSNPSKYSATFLYPSLMCDFYHQMATCLEAHVDLNSNFIPGFVPLSSFNSARPNGLGFSENQIERQRKEVEIVKNG